MATVMSSWPLYKDERFGRFDCIINESSWPGSYGTCRVHVVGYTFYQSRPITPKNVSLIPDEMYLI